jgi:hypothetical protein
MRWPTVISPAQFAQVTQASTWPAFLAKDVQPDGSLHTYANGRIDYRIKGVHAKVSVLWNFVAPEGGGDTHYSVMRGSNADLVIRQGAAEGYQPVLTIEPAPGTDGNDFTKALQQALVEVRQAYPGVDAKRVEKGWEIVVPASYHVGHEAHFAQVAQAFLGYVAKGALPAWEVPGMITKYATTTRALEMARSA